MRFSNLDREKIESSTDYITAYGWDMTILVWNNATAKVRQMPKHLVLGQNLFQVFPQAKEDFRGKCFVSAIQEKKSYFFKDIPYLLGSGVYTQLILPLNDDNDAVSGCICISRDQQPGDKIYSKDDLLQPILKQAPAK